MKINMIEYSISITNQEVDENIIHNIFLVLKKLDFLENVELESDFKIWDEKSWTTVFLENSKTIYLAVSIERKTIIKSILNVLSEHCLEYMIEEE